MAKDVEIRSEHDDEFYDDLVARALDRMESEGLKGVQAFLREFPEHQEVLRARLATLHSVGLVSGASVPKDGVPERLGEFRLQEKLGGGGMGVVYVAEQESLGRRVALKLVRPDLLYFPGARERFQREVQSIARLSHPAIVPVYSVGEDAGIPWFAMELVHGATANECIEVVAHRTPRELRAEDLGNAVSEVLTKRQNALGKSESAAGIVRERPSARGDSDSRVVRGESSETSLRTFHGSWPAACARVLLQAAEAVSHAHERGVLHRDLKPSNLMLTRSGRVLLFDFGLASAEGSHQITRSGIRLGSLAYMSPEQVDGDASALDPRSDIWSLGVSLYEMLTLCLPFRGETGDAIATAIRVCQPIPPRQLNPAIPEDLETVVLTALDRDPARRYATAKALADDLTNVLELRPIQARRPGITLRARRFVQRRPAASVALALGLVVVMGGPSLVFWQQQKSLAQEQRAAGEVRDALAKAESNLELALSAVETMLLRVGDKSLKDVPQADSVRRALLEDTDRFYGELRASAGQDLKTDSKAVHSLTRLMYLYLNEGDWNALEPVARRVVDQAEVLLARHGDNGDLLIFLAQGHEGLEAWHRFNGRNEDSLAEAELSLVAAEKAQKLMGLLPVPVVVLAGAIDRRARSRVLNGDKEAAEADYRQGIEIMRVLFESRIDEPEIAQRLAMALNNGADFLSNSGRPAEALPWMLEAVDILDMNIAAAPDSSEVIVAAATCEANLAQCYSRMAEPQKALEYATKGWNRLASFVEKFPERIDGLQAYASTGSSLGTMLNNASKFAEGVVVLRATVTAFRRLLTLVPESADAQNNFLVSLVNCASAERRTGSPHIAAELATESYVEFAKSGRSATSASSLFRGMHHQLGLANIELRNHVEAAKWAHALTTALPDDGIAHRLAGLTLSRSLEVIGTDPSQSAESKEALLAARTAEAVRTLARAKELGAVTTADLDNYPDYEALRARPEFRALRELPDASK